MPKRNPMPHDLTRLEELRSLYEKIYGHNPYYKSKKTFDALLATMDRAYQDRNQVLKARDKGGNEWFKKKDLVGVTLYVDLFSVDFHGFLDKLNYLEDLGITLIHFMPILKGRPLENDGGYAVMDYKAIDDRFGDFEIFERVCQACLSKGMHVALDFVINHTAKEHAWAQAALAGDKTYQAYYHMFDDTSIPDQYERTVPEVFPKVSPGNFTYYPSIDKHVMTSFYEFQWDLNYANPKVFEGVVDILLFLANKGVDMIRLDAIPFIWKELGTTCRNHALVHPILRMFHLIVEMVCPSVALLGEAIVAAEEIVGYFGKTEPECDAMYNAPMMVNLWNALATRDTRLLRVDMNGLQAPKDRIWINYIRCHDDIGWGFNEDEVKAMGQDPYLHKQFLIHFYLGTHEGSFANGALYEFDPKTMDARNCGTLASLCGLEKGIIEKDHYQIELAMKRIKLIFGFLLSSTGIPLIYSGDEIAMLNNHDYLAEEKKAHDSRWLHRSPFDWARLTKDPYGAEVHKKLKEMIGIRKRHEVFNAVYQATALDLGNKSVMGQLKANDSGTFIGLYNFSEDRQFIGGDRLRAYGEKSVYMDLLTGKSLDFRRESILLGPYEQVWLI